MPLTTRRQRFVEEYTGPNFGNATQAAIAAGFSAKTAGKQGHDLLQVPEVRKAIDERLDEYSMSSSEVLARLTRQARGTLAPFLKGLESEEARSHIDLVKEAEFDSEGWVKKLKIHDSQSALDKLAKARGIYEGEEAVIGKILVVTSAADALREMDEE